MAGYTIEEDKNSDFCSVIGDESVEIEIDLAADPKNLQDLNNQLTADITDMQLTLCDLRFENSKLSRERDTWQSEEMRFKEIISDKKAEITKFQLEIKRFEKRHSELTKQNNLLSIDYRDLYVRQNRKLSESKVEIEKLKEKILSLETALKERDEHICEKITAEVKTALQNNQEEMMKELTEHKREYQDKFDTMINFLTEKDRVQEDMFAMLKKFEEKIDTKQFTSEQQKPSFERQPKQSSNKICNENEVQRNYFDRRFNKHLVTNNETTEIQRLSLPENRIPIKRDDDGQTYDDEKSERVPNGKIVASNDTTKQSPSLVTTSKQMHYITKQQQRTSLEGGGQYNFPNISRQRSFNRSAPNAPCKYPQSTKSKK